MSERIFTLFGEEIVPEPVKTVGKGRAKKGKDKEGETVAIEEPAQPAEMLAEEISATAATAAIETAEEIGRPAETIIEAEERIEEQPEAILIATEKIEELTETIIEAEERIEEQPEAIIIAAEEIEELTETIIEAEEKIEEQPEAIIIATEEIEELSETIIVASERIEEQPEAIITATEKIEELTETAVVVEEKLEEHPEAIVIAAEEIEETQQQESAPKKEKTTKPPANLPENWEGDKQYYTIGEVAALFNVKTSHIRFWTNEFKLKVRTTRKGDRLYSPAQIKEVRAIYHLVKERGFTLTGAKAKLRSQNKIDVETIDLKQSLLKLRNQLEIIKKQLTA